MTNSTHVYFLDKKEIALGYVVLSRVEILLKVTVKAIN